MSAAIPKAETESAETEPPKKSGKGKLILAVVPIVLLLAGAGLWVAGVGPSLLGMERKPEQAEKKPDAPSYIELPEMVANLNSGNPRHLSYIKLSVRIEVPKLADVETIRAARPRMQDIMQTYLREMRPEELRGSAGTYRLREELLARANTAVAPARVSDVLFTQMLIQ